MNEQVKEKCDLLVGNRKILSQNFKWETGALSYAAACLYAGVGRQADAERLKECERILKSGQGVFSEFRGNVKMPLICKMALEENPAGYFDRIQAIYRMLNKSKVWGSEYKVMAAITICDHVGDGSAEKYVERTQTIYARMKQEHKWITSDEDTPFAALLAVSDFSVDSMVGEMEKIFALLKKDFKDSNAVQSLSHVLTLNERPAEEKCARVKEIFDRLKAGGHRYGTGYELASIGVLTMLEMPVDELVGLIVEADDYLKGQKGFGDYSLGARQRRMYAAQMVMDVFQPEGKGGSDIVLGSMLAYTIATELAMIMALSACAAANSASH